MVTKNFKRKGFTLIELLISIGVLGFALSVTGGILLSVVKSSQKQKVIAEVERNGEFVMSYIEKMGMKALSADCDGNSGTLVTCNSTTASQLALGQGTSSLFIGLKQGPAITCNGATKYNNFAYATDDESNLGDPKKLTNDTVNGVTVDNLDFVVTPGNPTHITVTMTVSNSSCGNWNVSKQFQSFITVRGTY